MKIVLKVARFWTWMISNLTSTQRVIVASILVGLVSGMMAVSLKLVAHTIQQYVSRLDSSLYLHAFLPFIGIVASVALVRLFLKDGLDRGSYQVLYAIGRKHSHIQRHQTYTHILTSGLTVGLGGSAGLESPIVQTGSAVGSNLSDLFPLNYRDRTLMIGCGAAAGLAAAFNAPIAGVLFALEVLLANASISAFIPLMIAGATGALCSKIVLDEEVLFHFQQQAFDYHNVPFYIGLGILCGLYSVYYIRAYVKSEALIDRIAKTPMAKLILGCSILSVLILLFPPLFGEGYTAIKNLADLQFNLLTEKSIIGKWITTPETTILFLIAILFVKVWATSFTLKAGGNGGNFAPALFAGGFLGYLSAFLVNYTGLAELPLHNFTLVGMAGVLCGVFHAPLTGIFLIAEITGGYDLMIPLMIVSSLSLPIGKWIEPKSLDAIKLAQKGFDHKSDHDSIILSALATGRLVETNFIPVRPETTLGELVKVIAQSKRNIFPVVNAQEELKGIIFLDQVREIMFDTAKYATLRAEQIHQKPPAILSYDEGMASVMEKFDRTNAWNLPVVKDNKYVGFVSKSMIFSEYRRWLQENSYE